MSHEELRRQIADNEVKGGSRFGRAVAELIAMTAQEHADDEELPGTISEEVAWAVATKPSMTSVRAVGGRASQALWEAEGRPSREIAHHVVETMRAFVTESESRIAQLGSTVAHVCSPGSTIAVHSYSESLVVVLRQAAALGGIGVLFTESRPLRESRHLMGALVDTDLKMALYSDASIGITAREADLAVVGADALLADGSFVNKVGSLPLALACAHYGTPMYVAGELSKLYAGAPEDVSMEMRPPEELVGTWELYNNGRVDVVNQFFERVPSELVTGYLTDEGILRPDELSGTMYA